MSDLVKFHIPGSFVLERVLPTHTELVYGYDQGWIDSPDVLVIALAMYGDGDAPPPVERLALLLNDELWRVPELIEELKNAAIEPDDPARAWLFLALAWVHENEADFIDPYETVEMLYADFGCPSAIDGFVRFMPSPPGERLGMSALDERWRSYLEAESRFYDARRRVVET